MNLFPRNLLRFLGVSLVLGATLSLSAQTRTDVLRLKQIANQAGQADARAQQQAQDWAQRNGWPTSLVLPSGAEARIVSVRGNRPLYVADENLQGATMIRATEVWPGGPSGLNLTGKGVVLGVWDGGAVDRNHPEFGTRVVQRDGVTSVSSHATHVAGTMAGAGVNPQAKGMSFEANLDAYSSGNDQSELANAASAGLQVSSHSYGPLYGFRFGARGDGRWVWFGDASIDPQEDYQFGFYDATSRAWDQLLYAAPFLLTVCSAGNDRNAGPAPGTEHWFFDPATNNWALSTATRKRNGEPGGWNTVNGSFKTSKNNLVIGAVNGFIGPYPGPNGVTMSSFSNFGPTDDGRIKPDLVAKGVNVLSSVPGGGYSQFSGTSMATPMVSGASGLLIEQFRRTRGTQPRAATLKAVMINNALEAGPTPGPDYAFGYGLLNVEAAAQAIAASAVKPDTLVESSLNTGQTFTRQIFHPGGQPLKVTIAWTDPAGTSPTPSLNPRTPILVNDLDLRVSRGLETFQPWTLDAENPGNAAVPGDNIRDNVEQVFIENAPAGLYTVTVSAKGALAPTGSQAFSMAVSVLPSGAVGFTIEPDVMVGGVGQAVGRVTLAEPAPKDGALVAIISSDSGLAKVPATITIPEGSSTGSFAIRTFGVLTQRTVTISVNAGGPGASANLTLEPVRLIGIGIDATSLVGGDRTTGWVELDGPAPTGGAAVQLQTSTPSVARMTRNWVLVPAGQTRTTFTIQSSDVTMPREVILTGERGGVSDSETIAIVPVTPESLRLSSTSVAGGSVVTGTVTLNFRAPSSGLTVNLSTSNREIASVPASITFKAGQTSVNFAVRTEKTSAARKATLTASRLGVTTSAELQVNP
ncbi:MAG TPA: S8 family serine peptidase [Fimbriimonadaceae bacterium]|nr:S8 family serine peptidase [Fimbriimonadaceae bacterium]HRJ32661.1 S8 family serine peptidase [Fimbriimonadaceae bacterium]